jgi:MFS family permease
VLVSALGAVVLGTAEGIGMLIVGRIAQGIGVSAMSGNATAAMVEVEPSGDRQRAGRVSSIAFVGGLALGPITAGLMAQYLPLPTLWPYVLETALLLAVLVLLTTIRTPGRATARGSRYHRPALPPERSSFLNACISVALVVALISLYTSLAPSYAEDILNLKSPALGGAIASVMIFSGVAATVLLRPKRPRWLTGGGMLSMMAGLVLIALSHVYPSIVLLLLSSVFSGAAFGAAFMGSLAIVNDVAPSARRGDVTSSYYAIGYLALGVPIIGLGLLAEIYNLFTGILLFVTALIAIGAVNLAWTIGLERRCPSKRADE